MMTEAVVIFLGLTIVAIVNFIGLIVNFIGLRQINKTLLGSKK